MKGIYCGKPESILKVISLSENSPGFRKRFGVLFESKYDFLIDCKHVQD